MDLTGRPRVIRCAVCGGEFETRFPRAKWCDRCRPEAQRRALRPRPVRIVHSVPTSPAPAVTIRPAGFRGPTTLIYSVN
jgi:hypothetical protein